MFTAQHRPVSASEPPRIAIWVESAKTEGHISLVERLTRSLMARGVDVLLLGDKGTLARRALEGIATMQLPDRDAPEYAEKFAQSVRDYRPNILITELMPFGYPRITDTLRPVFPALKQEMQDKGSPFELMSWTRDLPDPHLDPKYEGDRLSLEGITDHLDAIVIQGDKHFIPHRYVNSLPKRWQFAHGVRNKVHYMGYPIAQMQPLPSRDEVVVVAGGGFGDGQKQHFHNVLDAMPHISGALRSKTWRLFVSKDARPDERAELEAQAAQFDNVIIDVSGPSFGDAQKAADMLVTQGGMTSVECVALGKPTCIVPHVVRGGWAATNQVERGQKLANASPRTVFSTHLDAQKPEAFAQLLMQCYDNKDKPIATLPMLSGHEKFADWLVARCKQQTQGAGITGR